LAHSSLRPLAVLTALASLSACGGGDGDVQGNLVGGGNGGGGGFNNGGNGGSTSYQQGVFPARSTLRAKCAMPRTGTDPFSGQAYPDTAGTAMDEKMWLRSWTNDLYLWFNEVPDQDPTPFTVANYFETLQTPLLTPSGTEKDQFHFVEETSKWQALSNSGISPGYGVQFAILANNPRRIFVVFVEASSPAFNAGLERGDEIISVDGVLVSANDNASVATLNAGLFPEAANELHNFSVIPVNSGSSADIPVAMTSAEVVSDPVPLVQTIPNGSSTVGYILFNDHIATAEQELIGAIQQLSTAGVDDLVLDVRYNGGGFLAIASELAYMIAGPTNTDGKTFEKLVFNSKYTSTDPVTGDPLTPIPFLKTSQGFSDGPTQNLPTLGLNRVFVLTGPGTCSASESIINSLRGADVQVIQIGDTTCGKPYGFYPFDNCGTTYFSIQFKGVNAKNFGDYADGFSPANDPDALGEPVPGCLVPDDVRRPLGGATELLLSEALNYAQTGSCSVTSSSSSKQALSANASGPLTNISQGVIYKSPFLKNRILRQ
jgi:carboxyl-terminal processing protease